jgi:hypothetical protein
VAQTFIVNSLPRIAVFYHCLFSGGTIPVDTEFACSICAEQMRAFNQSGLTDAAECFFVGINGDEEDAKVARLFVPPKAKFIIHGSGATTEIPTLSYLRQWLPGHEDWRVLYTHIKAISHPGLDLYRDWRRRCEIATVWKWRECMAAMDAGVDTCGAHWLTPEQYPGLIVGPPFYGGTFWWSSAKHLMTLPPLPEATWANRYIAEKWIGMGPRRPTVKDFFPGWP